MDTNKISVLCDILRDMGCAVVCFTPEELGNVYPEIVEDRLIQYGWDTITSLSAPFEGRSNDSKVS